MNPARMPGRGRRFNEETVQMAMLFAAVLLLVFFLLVLRLHWDEKNGKTVKLRPMRNRTELIRRMLRGG